jgi:hypothetical protein
MKQDNYTDHAAMQANSSQIEDYFNGNYSPLPESTAEPKGKIIGWHWEPMHETYVLPNKTKGAA